MTETTTVKTRTPSKTIHRLGTTVAKDEAIEDGTVAMRVLGVCKILADADIAPTRDLIADRTGLKLVTVDEAIKSLRKLGLLSREPQSYRPIPQYREDRIVSGSPLPSGEFKVELGDDVLTLTPKEARDMGLILQGAALESAALSNQRWLMERMERMERENLKLKLELRKKPASSAQQELIGDN